MATEVDEEFVNAVKTARRGKPLKFAFIAKAQGGKLLLAKKILPKEIAEARKEIGGAAAIQGRCVGEEGILYFEVAKEVPQALPLQIKRAIKQDAGLVVDCLVRVKADADVEESSADAAVDELPTSTTTAAPATPESPKVAGQPEVLKRLQALAPAYQKAVALKGPDTAKMQDLFGSLKGLIDSKDFERVSQSLDELASLVAKTKGAPAAAPSTVGTGQVAVLKRLQALSADYKAAVEKKGPDVPRMQTLFGSLKGLIDAKDFAQASAVLDQLEHLIAAARSASNAPSAAAGKSDVLRRLNALTPELKTALGQKGPDVARIQTLFPSIKGLVDKSEFEQAAKSLDELEDLLEKRTAKSGATPDTNTESAKRWQAAKQSWQQAIETVDGQINQLQSKLRESDHPTLKRIAEFGLNGVTGKLKVGLRVAQMEFDDATGDARKGLHQKLLGAIKSVKSFVASDRAIQLIDENPLSVSVTIRQTLNGALEQMEKSLSGAG
jgi:hypothetical protein